MSASAGADGTDPAGTAAIVVFCTVENPLDAGRIAQALVEQRLAACVHVMPAGASVYRWQGTIEEAQEHLLVIKTSADRFEALRVALVEFHRYQVPEILALPVVAGHEPYLAWVHEQSRP